MTSTIVLLFSFHHHSSLDLNNSSHFVVFYKYRHLLRNRLAFLELYEHGHARKKNFICLG